jgi:signal transduction histidine kinase/CheY-like chemotaxis protein
LAATSGVLALAIGPEDAEFLLWFRAAGRDEPWEPFQIDLALELRNVMLGSIGKRAKELAQLNDELRASNFAKDEFLATVSHELRTPLNAMLGWLHMLESKQLPEPKREHALEVITRNARAQAKLIEDLLDVSRITSGKLRVEVQPLELATVVEAAIQGVRPAVEAKGIKLEVALAHEAGVVRGDPQRLQQVVWNLLTNAVKFTPRNGRIRVELERIDSHVALAVSDDGSGIPLEFLPHVFERFRQADPSSRRSYKGLGLGLAIVKHLVELHGGHVTASSPGEGQGATFVVHLPLAPLQEKPAVLAPCADADEPTAEPPAAQLAGLRVLVVDDEPDATDLLVTILSRAGMVVTPANSGTEAIEQLERASFDILLSDVGMPGMDGLDLVRRVRTLPAARGGRIPAVALTAFTRGQDRTRAFLAGFDLYLPKPIDPAELLALLGSLAGRLDRAPPEALGQLPERTRSRSEPPASGPLSGVRVLLVEPPSGDDAPLVTVLRDAGAQLETASDAAAASQVAERFRPELLVTGGDLPDGHDILRRLRAVGAEQGGWIPAVALVDAGSPEAGRKALLAGFQLYLQRPVEPGVLVSRLARLVAWTVRRP